jgi:hypothetical protein
VFICVLPNDQKSVYLEEEKIVLLNGHSYDKKIKDKYPQYFPTNTQLLCDNTSQIEVIKNV